MRNNVEAVPGVDMLFFGRGGISGEYEVIISDIIFNALRLRSVSLKRNVRIKRGLYGHRRFVSVRNAY